MTLDAACGCELIHDAAVDADILVFAELAELGEFDGRVSEFVDGVPGDGGGEEERG